MPTLDKFILCYNGNKYKECKKWDFINANDYDIIVEVFGGIFGMSRCLYEKFPDYKGEFWINDIDTEMITFFNQLKDKNYSQIDDVTFPETMTDQELTSRIKGQTIPTLIYKHSVGTIVSVKRGVPRIRNFNEKKADFDSFFQRCKFFSMTHDAFIDTLPKDKRVLVFYDPPYLNTSNAEYTAFCERNAIVDGIRRVKDVSQLYVDIAAFFHDHPEWTQLLVISEVALLHHLYKDYYFKDYEKTYGNTFRSGSGNGKCKAKHMVYLRKTNLLRESK